MMLASRAVVARASACLLFLRVCVAFLVEREEGIERRGHRADLMDG